MPNILTTTSSRLVSLSILLFRLTVGGILFGVGAGKALHWFGGFGLQVTLHFYSGMGIPGWLGYLSIYTEFIGGFLLMLGLFTRPVLIPILINMIVAFALTLPKGFFMGMASYPFSFAVSALSLLLTGPMAYSLDAVIWPARFADAPPK